LRSTWLAGEEVGGGGGGLHGTAAPPSGEIGERKEREREREKQAPSICVLRLERKRWREKKNIKLN